MNTKAILASLFATATIAGAADKAPDLTGADAKSFKAHLGRVVSLRGRLEEGVQGPCLHGATPKNVVFYVIADMPASGSYSYPDTWTRLSHRQVRITGQLKFRSFPQANRDAGLQTPPDYYYVVLQNATIEPIEPK